MEKKRIQSLMIIFLVVVIPGYIRLFCSSAFVSVRAVDIVQLLATGSINWNFNHDCKRLFQDEKFE